MPRPPRIACEGQGKALTHFIYRSKANPSMLGLQAQVTEQTRLVSEGWQEFKSLTKERSAAESALKIAKADWKRLVDADKRAGTRADRSVPLAFFSEKIRANEKVVLAHVGAMGISLQAAAPTLRGNRQIGIAAVTQDPKAAQFLSPELLDDEEVALAAASRGRASKGNGRGKGVNSDGAEGQRHPKGAKGKDRAKEVPPEATEDSRASEAPRGSDRAEETPPEAAGEPPRKRPRWRRSALATSQSQTDRHWQDERERANITKAAKDAARFLLLERGDMTVADVFAGLSEHDQNHFGQEGKMLAALRRDSRFTIELRPSRRTREARAQLKVTLRTCRPVLREEDVEKTVDEESKG